MKHTSLSYQSRGYLNRNGEHVVPGDGGRVFHVFDSSGRHSRTVDAFLGKELVAFTYDSEGLLRTITDHDERTITITRTAHDITIRAPYGQETTLRLDGNGWLSEVALPGSRVYQMTYEANGLLRSFSNPAAEKTNFQYDSAGRLVKHVDPTGAPQKLSRQDFGDHYNVTYTSAEGLQTNYRRENTEAGTTRTVTAPGGRETTTFSEREASYVTTHPDGTTTSALMSGDPRFGMLAPFVNHSQVTTPSGRMQSSTYEREFTDLSESDLTGFTSFIMREREGWQDPDPEIHPPWITTFDKAARTWTYQTPENRESVVTLDSAGRVATRQWPGMAPITYAYHPAGPHKGRLQSITQSARTWSVAYDAVGNLATLTNPLGEVTSLSYDAADRPHLVTLPDSDTIAFGFDPMGRLTSLDTPSRNEHAFGYDNRGLETSYAPPDATATTRVWDGDKRLTRINDPDAMFRQAQYDATTGDLKSILHEDGGNVGFDWNLTTGQLDEMTNTSGIVTRHEFDGPLLDAVEWEDAGLPVGSLLFDYMEDRFLRNSVVVQGAQSPPAYDITYEYDDDGLITAVDQMLVVREPETGRVDYSHVMGSVVNVVREYDAVYGELSAITVETSEPQPSFVLSYEERDLLGRTTKMVDTWRPSWNTTIAAESHYTYDARGRLKTVKKRPDDASPWDEQVTYTYDANGNRTKVETVTPTETTTTNATYATDDALLCTSDGTRRTTFTYTSRGSLASKVEMTTSLDCTATPTCGEPEYPCAETTYDYDAMGNLTAVVLPDDTFIEYQSDAAGRRVGKKVNGIVVARWLWDGQLGPIAELAPDGSMTSVFVYADGVNSPDYMVRGGLEYTFVKDALGSVRQVLDSNGVVMQAISYDAWGVPTATAGSLDYQPFGFAGGLWDVDTGLVRFGARDYDALIGRWTAKDPIRFGGGDSNLYAYVFNDPVNFTDATGLLVDINYNRGTGTLTVMDWSTGQYFEIYAESGGKPWGDPIPAGQYDILERAGRSGFFRLDAHDDNPLNDIHDPSGRNHFRLHGPGRTIGCIAATDKDDWSTVDDLIRNTSTEIVQDMAHPWWKFWWRPSPITRFGRLTVE